MAWKIDFIYRVFLYWRVLLAHSVWKLLCIVAIWPWMTWIRWPFLTTTLVKARKTGSNSLHTEKSSFRSVRRSFLRFRGCILVVFSTAVVASLEKNVQCVSTSCVQDPQKHVLGQFGRIYTYSFAFNFGLFWQFPVWAKVRGCRQKMNLFSRCWSKLTKPHIFLSPVATLTGWLCHDLVNNSAVSWGPSN